MDIPVKKNISNPPHRDPRDGVVLRPLLPGVRGEGGATSSPGSSRLLQASSSCLEDSELNCIDSKYFQKTGARYTESCLQVPLLM